MKIYHLIVVFILLLLPSTIRAKSTYYPTYRNYMHIITGIDTVSVANDLDTMVMQDPSGMFALRIDQEEVTKEKVKEIKWSRRAAGWAVFSSTLSGVSAAFSDNSLEGMVRRKNAIIAADLAEFYKNRAAAIQSLEIDFWLDNICDEELMICDLERGLTWWLLPRQTVHVKFHNPDATMLRISDAQNRTVRYVLVAAGNSVTKVNYDLETDEYWYKAVWREPNGVLDEQTNLMHCIRISKVTHAEEKRPKQEFIDLKAEQKRQKKAKK